MKCRLKCDLKRELSDEERAAHQVGFSGRKQKRLRFHISLSEAQTATAQEVRSGELCFMM